MLTKLTLVIMLTSVTIDHGQACIARCPMSTIVIVMTRRLPLAPYIVDTLVRDLVGHDRAPSAFLVYLWLWHNTRGLGRRRLGASLQMLATETGLSKSSIQ